MKTTEWGLLIVLYLFLGGLSAGLFFVSSVATLFAGNGETPHSRLARWGAMLAPWPVALGSLLLVLDLGHWYRSYLLFLHFRWTSPMSIGAWLLLLFLLASLAHFNVWLPADRRERFFSELPRRLRFLRFANRDLSAWQRPIAALGLPLSLGVGIYTGVLLGAVQSRPFWNTNLVAQLFLFSALSTGCAALLFLFSLSRSPLEAGDLRMLFALDTGFLALEFFIVLPYIIHGQLSVQAVRHSLKLILGGPFTLVFWLFFLGLGLLLPLGVEVREILPVVILKKPLHVSRWLTAATAFLVLVGGFLLRYIFVFAGQQSAIE